MVLWVCGERGGDCAGVEGDGVWLLVMYSLMFGRRDCVASCDRSVDVGSGGVGSSDMLSLLVC